MRKCLARIKIGAEPFVALFHSFQNTGIGDQNRLVAMVEIEGVIRAVHPSIEFITNTSTCGECQYKQDGYCRKGSWRYDEIRDHENCTQVHSQGLVYSNDKACPDWVPK